MACYVTPGYHRRRLKFTRRFVGAPPDSPPRRSPATPPTLSMSPPKSPAPEPARSPATYAPGSGKERSTVTILTSGKERSEKGGTRIRKAGGDAAHGVRDPPQGLAQRHLGTSSPWLPRHGFQGPLPYPSFLFGRSTCSCFFVNATFSDAEGLMMRFRAPAGGAAGSPRAGTPRGCSP